MKTKFLTILSILALSITMASAQGTDKMSFGVLGGINFQNLNGKNVSGDKLENEMILGYHAGVNVQIPIAPQFYFQPGLIFSTKGAKNITTVLGVDYTTTTKLSYIEMPLNLVYKAMLGNGYFMLGFGPYIGYGIAGKVVTEGGSISLDQDIEFQNVVETSDDMTVPYYKALDFGGNIFAGYELSNGIFAQFNTQLGMVKINPEYKILSDDESIVKNTGFGLSMGYRF
jgi:hypothetical protein